MVSKMVVPSADWMVADLVEQMAGKMVGVMVVMLVDT